MFERKYKYLDLLASLLTIIVTTNIILHIIYDGTLFELFWFCNMASLLGSAGIFFRNKLIVNGTLIAAVPAQILWITDFLLSVLLDTGLGRTEGLFTSSENLFVFIVSVLLHSILIPILVYATYKIGRSLRRGAFFALFVYGYLLILISYFFTPVHENINCVFFPCDLGISDAYEGIESGAYNSIYYLLKVFSVWSTALGVVLASLYLFKMFAGKRV